MDIFLQQIINGLTLGCVYAVVALGYTMVYGIIQLINFAHGEVVMIGAMVAFSVIGALMKTGMPPLLVDPILIEQVLLNLLKNAAESVDAAQRPLAQRHVKLRVAPRRVNDREVIEFSVTDTGRGLTPEVSARLYEAFYSTKADGMGIGLSLCRSIVESHLGRMTAENLYNGPEATGCVFSFWLPRMQTETSPSTEPQPTAKDVR